MFSEIDSEQMFHVIDTIIADNAVEDVDNNLTEVRVKINNLHGKDGGQDFRDYTSKNYADPKQVVPEYLEATSEAGGGFPGLLPPLT